MVSVAGSLDGVPPADGGAFEPMSADRYIPAGNPAAFT